ncbi:nuclear transport factor 2-like protein [Spirosoma validum]|uniref:Nuclear transport factor 2 family protein n=1 Tax=Spirosoma validum TaxID=2771355 RepID=A0A927GE54_9BACT|nr:nuclear transport factor 2 family protein [Spirosoma validum]MBD2754271.1 nuclear transport factor 2 family protein [Spirosoma validum]
MASLSELAVTLAELIEANQTIKAMERFYADDVTMQENEDPLRIGKAICLQHERYNLSGLIELKAKLLHQAINETTGVVFSEWYMEATYLSGKRFSVTEVSVQHWRNELIYKEKFYYNKLNRIGPANSESAL